MTDSHSPNLSEELKKKLQALVPETFKDGQLDVETLKRLLGSETELRDESYGLNWLGKSYGRLLANENALTWLRADDEHNVQPGNTNSQNLLIKGDNLEVLKHLLGAYEEEVKMIYIDPPYNTGSDGFVYADDRKFTVEQLSQLAGIDEDEAKRILEFTQAKSNSHSAWLTFMYPRLYIARQLLRDDGLIFISIDDNEQAQLKLLCDEVFGEECFVALVPTVMNLKGNQDNFGFADTHEYFFAYAKDKSKCNIGVFDIDEESFLSDWKTDEYGLYKEADNLRATGVNAPREKRRNLWYPIFLDLEKEEVYVTNDDRPLKENHQIIYPKNPEGNELSWYWGKATFNQSKHNLIIKQTKNGWQFYRKQRPDLGELPTKKPKSFFYKPDYSTSTATTKLKELMGSKVFQAPKPLPFIKDLVKIGAFQNDLILDFFAGSGTAAHAVMQLNAEDGGNREFMCVQLDEDTDHKSEAYKAGYKSIFDITKARIEKAAAKIKAENPDYQGDFGFKIYETAPIPDKYQDTPEDLTENLELFDANKLTQTDRLSLMRTWALQDSVPLTLDLLPVDLAGYTAYQAKHILYFIEPNISIDAVVKLLEQLDNNPDFKPNRLVVFGYLLESKIQREMTEAVKQYNNRKGIELTLDVRY